MPWANIKRAPPPGSGGAAAAVKEAACRWGAAGRAPVRFSQTPVAPPGLPWRPVRHLLGRGGIRCLSFDVCGVRHRLHCYRDVRHSGLCSHRARYPASSITGRPCTRSTPQARVFVDKTATDGGGKGDQTRPPRARPLMAAADLERQRREPAERMLVVGKGSDQREGRPVLRKRGGITHRWHLVSMMALGGLGLTPPQVLFLATCICIDLL